MTGSLTTIPEAYSRLVVRLARPFRFLSQSSEMICAIAEGQRPNFVLILADDLGCSNLSCSGADELATPNIDRIAVACSRTRASLMTEANQLVLV